MQGKFFAVTIVMSGQLVPDFIVQTKAFGVLQNIQLSDQPSAGTAIQQAESGTGEIIRTREIINVALPAEKAPNTKGGFKPITNTKPGKHKGDTRPTLPEALLAAFDERPGASMTDEALRAATLLAGHTMQNFPTTIQRMVKGGKLIKSGNGYMRA